MALPVPNRTPTARGIDTVVRELPATIAIHISSSFLFTVFTPPIIAAIPDISGLPIISPLVMTELSHIDVASPFPCLEGRRVVT